jgi:pyruvate formate-lyase activating enzyme-like uncharacterized protein
MARLTGKIKLDWSSRVQEDKIERLIGFYSWLTKIGLTPEEAQKANAARQPLLDAIQSGVEYRYQGSKACYGGLSRGCQTCGAGTWSCLFINGLCTAHCFFCPQDRSMTEERPPYAEEMLFEDLERYLAYLERFGFQGVGFSGGETFLAFDKLLEYLAAVRRRFPDMYIWLYTNGDLVEDEKLAALDGAGLDEIRFNISARGYDLAPVALGREFVRVLTVEIPCIPEYKERLKRSLVEMERIGVDHLNLHQLVATRYNYEKLARRGYTFLPPLAFHEPPVLESELVALEIISYAHQKNLKTPINYCSHAYKARYQNLSRRQRAAQAACRGEQDVTNAGYIRSLVVNAPTDELAAAIDRLRHGGVPESRWSLIQDGSGLAIHPDALAYLDLQSGWVALEYTEADIVSLGFLKSRKLAKLDEILLGDEEAGEPPVYLGVKPAGGPFRLELAVVRELCEHSSQPAQWGDVSQGISLTPGDRETLETIQAFDHLPSGYQEIAATR